MPNPKIGCVLPPNGNVKAVYERLQKTKRLMSRDNPIVQCSIGKEDATEEELVDNVMTVYNALVHALPNEKHNIKSAYLKLTMGKAFMIGEKQAEEKPIKKESTEKKPEKKKEVKEETKEKPIKEKSNNEKSSNKDNQSKNNKQPSDKNNSLKNKKESNNNQK